MSEDKAVYRVAESFKGFPSPEQNYSKLPHAFINLLPTFDSMAELKVVIYILRHTWGFSEFDKPKRITTDEFMNGRKKKDGSRMDKGTGLASNSVVSGLSSAVEHGYINVETDDKDKARIKKFYSLNMEISYANVEELNGAGYAKSEQLPSESEERSEKETTRNKKGEEIKNPAAVAATPEIPTTYNVDWQMAGGVETIIVPDEAEEFRRVAKSWAWQIAMNNTDLEGLAYEFMISANKIPCEKDVKLWRKAFRGYRNYSTRPATANDIRLATEKHIAAQLSIKSPLSIEWALIEIISPTPESKASKSSSNFDNNMKILQAFAEKG